MNQKKLFELSDNSSYMEFTVAEIWIPNELELIRFTIVTLDLLHVDWSLQNVKNITRSSDIRTGIEHELRDYTVVSIVKIQGRSQEFCGGEVQDEEKVTM